MKSDNLVQLSGFLTKDVITNEKKSFAAFTIGRKVGIDDCITYILNTVQKSGYKGFADDEIYSMAVHYYEEENIEVGKLVNCQVVVNHQVELTPEEIAEMRQKAKDEVFRQEQDRLKNHNSVRRTVKPTTTPQHEEETLTLF